MAECRDVVQLVVIFLMFLGLYRLLFLCFQFMQQVVVVVLMGMLHEQGDLLWPLGISRMWIFTFFFEWQCVLILRAVILSN